MLVRAGYSRGAAWVATELQKGQQFRFASSGSASRGGLHSAVQLAMSRQVQQQRRECTTSSDTPAAKSSGTGPPEGEEESKPKTQWEEAMDAASFALSGDGAVEQPKDPFEAQFFDTKRRLSPHMTRQGCDNVEPAFLKKDKVREAFRLSVQARTVGNHQLRKYLRYLDNSEYESALEAAKGAQEAGLRLDAETCEVLLGILLRSGQLKAAMELYQTMVKNRIAPHTKSYNHLIELAVNKESPFAAKALYDDMRRKGRSPDVQTYELLMKAYALEKPPQWEEAVEIFDNLQAKRNHQLSASTYNALMTVYLNMHPFDHRIVYNAYYEMRYSRPRIRFGWDSYDLVATALVKGGAPLTTRLAVKADAWSQIVSMKSPEFWGVTLLAVAFIGFIRWGIVKFLMWTNTIGSSESEMDVASPVVKAR